MSRLPAGRAGGPTGPGEAAPIALHDSVRRLHGVGPARATMLEGEGLPTIFDLLARAPIRYEDRSRFGSVAEALPGRPSLLLLSVVSSRLIRTRRRDFTITEAYLRDATGTLRATWFNRPYLARSLAADRRLVLFGTLAEKGGDAQLDNPDYELLDEGDEADGSPHFARVVPVHRRLETLSGKAYRTVLFGALAELEGAADQGPAHRARVAALRRFQFPESLEAAAEARRQLAREEIREFLVGLELRRAARRRAAGFRPRVASAAATLARLERLPPFALTRGQRGALSDVLEDLSAARPMARLVHGEVGSGKTIVALLSAVPLLEARRQVALLAPTEVLAQQLLEQAERLFGGGRAVAAGRPLLLSGSVKGLDRNHALLRIARGEAGLVVGTHALFQEKVVFQDLGLVVVDEQQRFGVAERAALLAKASGGREPDLLVMSATPIPRTLTLTLYGDLDVSRIDEPPPGRGAVATRVLDWAERTVAFEALEAAVGRGEQGFVVVPRIEEAPEPEQALPRAKTKPRRSTLENVVAGLREKRPGWRLGVLHGRLDPAAKSQVAARMRRGELDVVVATTVVEVGVDVPGASVMIVMGADAFGLSQLHQLRGRTGRGGAPGNCFFVLARGAAGEARDRVAAMESLTDGFRVAEADWRRRGPGELGGGRQWGSVGFRFADLAMLDEALGEERPSAVAEAGRLAPDAAAATLARWEREFAAVGVG